MYFSTAFYTGHVINFLKNFLVFENFIEVLLIYKRFQTFYLRYFTIAINYKKQIKSQRI